MPECETREQQPEDPLAAMKESRDRWKAKAKELEEEWTDDRDRTGRRGDKKHTAK